jgi:hypothetical protein
MHAHPHIDRGVDVTHALYLKPVSRARIEASDSTSTLDETLTTEQVRFVVSVSETAAYACSGQH